MSFTFCVHSIFSQPRITDHFIDTYTWRLLELNFSTSKQQNQMQASSPLNNSKQFEAG